MEEFKRIIVGLDLSDLDKELIPYAAYLDKVIGFEHITFIHVARNLQLPGQLVKDYPDLMSPLDETFEKEMIDEINGHFLDSKAEIEFKVEEGHPETELLKWVRIKEADLLILGKKRNENGAGVVPSKVGRAARSSVLIVTEGARLPIKKILVPVDFSVDSEHCLKTVLGFSGPLDAELMLENVYSVPTGYTKTGKSFEEFAEIMLRNATGEMNEFLKNSELETLSDKVIYRLDKGHDASDEIMESAEEKDADLIAIGSKGRSDPAAFFLGSLAEKLIQRNYSIPVLVNKNKGKVMKFLEALMNI